MTVARTVADVLTEHVTLEVECIDRMFLNVYQPRLQHAGGHRQLRAPAPWVADRVDRAVGEDQ